MKIGKAEFEKIAKIDLVNDVEVQIGENEYYNSPTFGSLRIYRNKVFKWEKPYSEILLCELMEE
jgi:hypothetical protein